MKDFTSKSVGMALHWDANTVLYVSKAYKGGSSFATIAEPFKINHPEALHAKLHELYKPAEDLNLKALTAYTDIFYDEPLSKHIDKIDLVDASGNVRTFDIKYVFTDERQSNQSAHDRFVHRQIAVAQNRDRLKKLCKKIYGRNPGSADIRLFIASLAESNDKDLPIN